MDSYLDTSFLLKAYVFEAESDEVLDWMREHRRRLVISPLSDVEVITALNREFARSAVVAMRAIDSYREDLALGLFRRLEIDAEVFAKAENIAEHESAKYGLRSLDILHLATALRHEVESITTFDIRLRKGAAGMGLKVFPERS